MLKKLLFPLLFCLILVLPAHASLTKGTDPAPATRKLTVPQAPKERVIVIRTAKDPKINQVKVGEKGEILIPQSTAIAGAAVAGAAVAAATPTPTPGPAGAPKGAEAGDDAQSSHDSKKEGSGLKSTSGSSGIRDSKTSDLSSGSSDLFGGSGSGILGGGAPTGFTTIPDETPVTPTSVFPGSSTNFAILASAGDRGTINPSGSVTVASGANQTFTITPNANFHVDEVLVDGVSQGAITSFTFSSVTASHTIVASFTTPTQELQALLNQTVSDDGIPGAILAVQTTAVQTTSDTWIGAAGKADLGDITGTPQDMAIDTQVRLAGVSRLLTAALVMKLVEDGKFKLDNTLESLLSPVLGPGTVPSGDKITVSMLLNHTSGLHDHETTQEFFSGLISFPSLYWDPFADLLPLIESYPTLNFAPGTDFKNCSTDYYLLGLLAGTVAGNIGASDPLLDVQAGFFTALNLSNTNLTISGLFDQVNPFARTYSWPGVPEFPTLTDTTDWDLSFDWTNGCGISTGQDILSFTQALFAGNVVNSQSLEQMTTPQPPVNYSSAQGPLPYGYGLEVVNSDPWFGEKAYKSDGDTTGAYTRWLYYPDSKRIIFIAFNRADKRFNTDPPIAPAPSAPQVDAAKKADDLLKAVSEVLKAVK